MRGIELSERCHRLFSGNAIDRTWMKTEIGQIQLCRADVEIRKTSGTTFPVFGI